MRVLVVAENPKFAEIAARAYSGLENSDVAVVLLRPMFAVGRTFRVDREIVDPHPRYDLFTTEGGPAAMRADQKGRVDFATRRLKSTPSVLRQAELVSVVFGGSAGNPAVALQAADHFVEAAPHARQVFVMLAHDASVEDAQRAISNRVPRLDVENSARPAQVLDYFEFGYQLRARKALGHLGAAAGLKPRGGVTPDMISLAVLNKLVVSRQRTFTRGALDTFIQRYWSVGPNNKRLRDNGARARLVTNLVNSGLLKSSGSSLSITEAAVDYLRHFRHLDDGRHLLGMLESWMFEDARDARPEIDRYLDAWFERQRLEEAERTAIFSALAALDFDQNWP